uniref:Uncharacterized protein n=1 Tax=Arundo donax TaxID=35708 RepID=A0A0A9FSC5_ARUDO
MDEHLWLRSCLPPCCVSNQRRWFESSSSSARAPPPPLPPHLHTVPRPSLHASSKPPRPRTPTPCYGSAMVARR